MQDTLYLSSPMPADDKGRRASLLRTHTSGMQIRYMETHPPPVRIIAPGRVYRRDNFDATHTPMFTQVEGLVVDEGISARRSQGHAAGVRRSLLRRDGHARASARASSRTPSRRPNSTSSARAATARAARSASTPAGSRCSAAAWFIRPSSRPSATTPRRYTGFAFGVGIERLALRLYGVDDIRMFYENDLRFLEQLAP